MFDRTISLIGNDNLEKIKKTNILLVGVGGVGGFALEALVRSGIQNITIIDYDSIDYSNLNRQIISNISNIGIKKTEEAKKRAQLINKDINITVKNLFLDESNISKLELYDYIIDACDSINTKASLIRYALNSNIKIITCCGTGKRLNPEKLSISTLDKTYNDPLAKKLRNNLKDIDLKKVKVVFSNELPLNNNKEISSMIFVPASAGIMIASYIINDIIKE